MLADGLQGEWEGREGTEGPDSNRVEDDGADAAGGELGRAGESGGAAADDGDGGVGGDGGGEHHLLLVEALLDGRPPREPGLPAPRPPRGRAPAAGGSGHHSGEAGRRERGGRGDEGRLWHHGCSTKCESANRAVISSQGFVCVCVCDDNMFTGVGFLFFFG